MPPDIRELFCPSFVAIWKERSASKSVFPLIRKDIISLIFRKVGFEDHNEQ